MEHREQNRTEGGEVKNMGCVRSFTPTTKHCNKMYNRGNDINWFMLLEGRSHCRMEDSKKKHQK